MNIEATLEDLEAQGYFATQTSLQTNDRTGVCGLVRVNFADSSPTKYLARPILGANFIGGFTTNQPSSNWLAINLNQVSHIDNLDSQTLLETPATLLQVITEHFIEITLELGLAQKRLSGKVMSLLGNCVNFLREDRVSCWIPESNISYVAVEKLSNRLKL